MGSGNGNCPADLLCIAKKNASALKLSCSRSLGQISGDRYDVELLTLYRVFDCIDLGRNGRAAEMKIGYVEDSRHGVSSYCATTMSANFVARSRASMRKPYGLIASDTICGSRNVCALTSSAQATREVLASISRRRTEPFRSLSRKSTCTSSGSNT